MVRLRIRLFAWVMSLLSAMACGSFAQVIHVDADATGAEDGSSWCDAFRDLQAGFDGAAPGTTILVANGIYLPDVAGLANPREATFALVSGVTLEGGYAGCGAPEPASRDIAANETILSGDLNGDDEPDFVNRDDNCYHVVITHDVDELTVLDGVTIRGGRADGPNFGPSIDSQDQGAGVNNYHGHPRLIGCTLVDNYASNHGAFNDHGGATLIDCSFRDNFSGGVAGGLYMHFGMDTTVTRCTFYNNTTAGLGGGAYHVGSATATFIDCVFSGNLALFGGGMYCDNDSNPTLTRCTFTGNSAQGDDMSRGGGLYNNGGSSPTLSTCLFSNNTATHKGGAVYNHNNSSPVLSHCSFVGNSAAFGGAMYNFLDTAPLLTHCTFEANSVSGAGGAMYNRGSNPAFTRPTMVGCSFVGNLATSSIGEGGAIYSSTNAAPNLTDCLFVNNRSRVAGGAMASYAPGPGLSYLMTRCTFIGNVCTGGRGGAMQCTNTGVYELNNCVLSGNSAVDGGAMSIFNTNVILTNCTVSRNDAQVRGGGLWISSLANVTITNSILWANSVVDTGATDEPAQIQLDSGTVSANFSCIEGLTQLFAGEGNIGDDPRFADTDGLDGTVETADDNLRLMDASPCIDGGDNSVTTESTDLDGNPRIVDGDGDSTAVVDMGAYEFQRAGAPIPTASEWGIIVMILLTLTAGTLILTTKDSGAVEKVKAVRPQPCS